VARSKSQFKSQTKSQRPQTRGVTRLQPATIVAGRCHIRRQQATSSDGKNAPYKRGAGGSNPPAPTRQNTDLVVIRPDRRAINVPLAVRLIVAIGAVAALDHAADRVGDAAAGLAGGVLVHHRGAHAVVPHTLHQVPQARPALTGQRVAGMAEIMEMQAGGADRGDRSGSADSAPEVATAKRPAAGTGKEQCIRRLTGASF